MRPLALIMSVFLSLPIVIKAGGPDAVQRDSTLSFSGIVDFSVGEIMEGMYKSSYVNAISPTTFRHAWFGYPLGRFNLTFVPSERVTALLGFEGHILLNNYPLKYNSPDKTFVVIQYMEYYLHQAQAVFSLVKNTSMSLDLSLGYMPYKYNPEVHNLGEYLFRSGTYPFFLINDFNFPFARLSGLRVNYKLSVGSFGVTFDQFVLTERTLRPFNDISLASVAGINWKKIIDAGIGVEFAHLLPVDSRYTSPVLSGTRYPTGTGDSGTYTFKGTKVMARATIDPFALKRGRNSFLTALLGENGGKMYGEWAVIGLESYPATNPVSALGNPYGYDKIKEKMPWMVGINIPLWKLLDVCAFEIEKYPAPYPNDYENVVRGTVEPLPVLPAAGTEYDSASYRIDRWYWSLYMKRQIVKHFNVIGQIAHDHVKWDMPAGNVENYDFEDILVKPGQWAWRIVGSLEF